MPLVYPVAARYTAVKTISSGLFIERLQVRFTRISMVQWLAFPIVRVAQGRWNFRLVLLVDFGRSNVRREDARLNGVDSESDGNFSQNKVSRHGFNDLLQRCLRCAIGKLRKTNQPRPFAISSRRARVTLSLGEIDFKVVQMLEMLMTLEVPSTPSFRSCARRG